jgi:hypothetical protein
MPIERYALIRDGKIENVVVLDAESPEGKAWIELVPEGASVIPAAEASKFDDGDPALSERPDDATEKVEKIARLFVDKGLISAEEMAAAMEPVK